MDSISPNTMIPGKYYEAKYGHTLYLCKAIRHDFVQVRWVINTFSGIKRFRDSLDGAVYGNDGIREISYHYYKSGEEPPNNKSAISILDKEW